MLYCWMNFSERINTGSPPSLSFLISTVSVQNDGMLTPWRHVRERHLQMSRTVSPVKLD
jgi:hypothetical protein